MAAAAATKLLKLQPVRRVLFVLRRYVIALFALRALQNNVISRHTSFFLFGVPSLGGYLGRLKPELRTVTQLLQKLFLLQPYGRLRG